MKNKKNILLMIKQLVSMVLILIWFIYSSFGMITPSLLIRQEDFMTKIIKNGFQNLLVYMIKYGFDAKIYYNGEIKPEKDKVNILISNHIGSLDGFMLLTILKYFDVEDYYAVGKKEIIYIPGIGMCFMFAKDIKLSRNWDEDKLTIEDQLSRIEEGMIIIFPEGTRFDPDKHKEGQKFSIENNLPVYENLLVPKSKGLMTIYNYLKKNNKLGKVIDISFIVPNFLGKTFYFSELLKKDIDNVYLIIRDIEYNEEDGDFKEWLLSEWFIKDRLISNYKNFMYQKMVYKTNPMILMISLLFVAITTVKLFNNRYFRYYMIMSVMLAYIMAIIYKNVKI